MLERIQDKNKNRLIRFVYISAYVLMSLLFLKILYSYIVNSVFELDLLWYFKTVATQTQGLSGIKLFSYLFTPFTPWFEGISGKLYMFFVLALFGPLAKALIIILVIFHFSSSILLFLLAKKLGLSSRISFLSSLMYLVLFAHFQAYLWPIAIQHIATVFFVLLGLNFYLKTDGLISSGVSFRSFFMLTLLINFIASFIRFHILILPAMILMHILTCAKDDKDRIKKFDIWLPLFVIYLLFPLFVIASGDARIKMLLLPLAPFFTNTVLGNLIYKINIFARFAILFLLGILSLFIFRLMLVLYQKNSFRRVLKWVLINAAIVIMLLLIYAGGLKRLLIPFNLLAPFVGILASFLAPLQNALLINSAHIHYFIPLQLNVFNFLLSLLLLALFVKSFIHKHRQLIILVVMYLCSLGYLYLLNPVVSRYFIFLSPLFCIIFCSVSDYAFSSLIKSARFNETVKTVILITLLIALCIPNLLAIKLALFRGKLANTLSTYDYIRTAHAIKDDLIKTNHIKEIEDKKIYVNNVIPIETYALSNDISISDPYGDNFRYVFMQVFNDSSVDVKVNQSPPENESYIAYSLNGDRINNAQGINISSFSRLFEEGVTSLRLNQYERARQLFRRAIEKRPFLFNYLLSDLELKDLGWITDEQDLRDWINKMECVYNSLGYKGKHLQSIFSLINTEINQYIQSLFYMSFIDYISGNTRESEYWFLEIRFLEQDYHRLRCWLSEVDLVKSNKTMLSFLNNFNNNSLYVRQESYRDRFKFERFLFGLLFKT